MAIVTKVRHVMRGFQQACADATLIETMLGRPKQGRADADPPVITIEIVAVGTRTAPTATPRLGSLVAPERQVAVAVTLFANDELSLIDMISAADEFRRTSDHFLVDGAVVQIRTSDIQRNLSGGEVIELDFSAVFQAYLIYGG